MILKIFSVYDTAAGAYLQPFFAPTLGLAIRSFQDAVNTPDHQFARYSHDYTLYLLGEFNDSDASFSPQQEPVRVATATETKMTTVASTSTKAEPSAL